MARSYKLLPVSLIKLSPVYCFCLLFIKYKIKFIRPAFLREPDLHPPSVSFITYQSHSSSLTLISIIINMPPKSPRNTI